MSSLKRTVLYESHIKLGASMVDFNGWEMPVNYPGGVIEEHLGTRKKAGIFDVSHMGRFFIAGAEAARFLQYVLTNNVCTLGVNQSQYTMLANENGGALDDAFLYRTGSDEYLLVVNAGNLEKDLEHLTREIKSFNAHMEDRSKELAMISLQGPESNTILEKLTGSTELSKTLKNSLTSIIYNNTEVLAARTGYTGEPYGFELFVESAKAAALWGSLLECGAMAIGLGARDTLRLEAGLPLYGHELGTDCRGKEIPIYACPKAKFAVSFSEEKGSFIGKEALLKQFEAYQKIMQSDFSDLSGLPQIIRPFALKGKGVARAGCRVLQAGVEVGCVTSGTMIPYLKSKAISNMEKEIPDIKAEGDASKPVNAADKGLRAIGFAMIQSNISKNDEIEIEIRGNKVKAMIVPYHLKGSIPPYARPVIFE